MRPDQLKTSASQESQALNYRFLHLQSDEQSLWDLESRSHSRHTICLEQRFTNLLEEACHPLKRSPQAIWAFLHYSQ